MGLVHKTHKKTNVEWKTTPTKGTPPSHIHTNSKFCCSQRMLCWEFQIFVGWLGRGPNFGVGIFLHFVEFSPFSPKNLRKYPNFSDSHIFSRNSPLPFIFFIFSKKMKNMHSTFCTCFVNLQNILWWLRGGKVKELGTKIRRKRFCTKKCSHCFCCTTKKSPLVSGGGRRKEGEGRERQTYYVGAKLIFLLKKWGHSQFMLLLSSWKHIAPRGHVPK